jgi:hypothetical protein
MTLRRLIVLIKFLCGASTTSCGSLYFLREVTDSQHIKLRACVFTLEDTRSEG